LKIMWGIVPAAGNGARIQPLAFSKELLPVGSREDGNGEHPKAVSEYLLERLTIAGATRLCFVICPGKTDILQYYGAKFGSADCAYVIQPHAAGLCDAIFRARPLIHPEEPVAVGLPDTIWLPEDALRGLPDDRLAFLLFPVKRPELFDAVLTDAAGNVLEIQVKSMHARTRWIWGAFTVPGRVYHELFDLWHARGERDQYVGTLVNAWLHQGRHAVGIRAGEDYVDVGTLHGYREALRLLAASTANRGDRRASGRRDPGARQPAAADGAADARARH
jgi:glucose-1-phosphate thymidylyltransferase